MWAAALSSLILAAVCLSSSKAQQCKRTPPKKARPQGLKGMMASENNLGRTDVFMTFLDKGRAPGKMDIMDTSMSMISSAGAMTGTTVGSIMALSYPITIGGVLENYSKYYLTRVDCKNDAGYINKPLRAIHPEKKEVWASHRGMPGTASHVFCKIEVEGLETGKEKLIYFYYKAPNAFSESNNNELWLSVCEKKKSNCKLMNHEVIEKFNFRDIEVVHSKFYYDVDELVTCGKYVMPDSRELCIVAKMGTSHNAEMYISVYGSKLKHANEKMQKAYADTKPDALTQVDYAPFIESIKEGFNAEEGTAKRKKKVQKTFNGTKPEPLTQDDYAPFIESIKEGFNAEDTGKMANNVQEIKKEKKQSMKKKKESTKKKKINTTKESKRDEIAEDEDDATVEEVEEEGAADIAGDEENAREKEFTNEEGDDKEEQEENGSGKAAIAREPEENAPAPAPAADTKMSNATDEGPTKRGFDPVKFKQLYDKAAHFAQVAEIMTAGASIVGTSVSALMDRAATVAFAAHIENYSKYDLTKANCHASSGYINKPLRSIHSGTKEAFAAKQSSSGYGVYVYCKMRVAGAGVDKKQLGNGKIVEEIGSTLKHYVHFMIYVPADKGNRGQYLGVAVCHDGGNDGQCEKIDSYSLKADALYYGKTYNKYMKRELYYNYQPDVYVCPPEQPVCVVATMGTSHKPIVYINVYGKTLDDAMPKMVEDMTDEKNEIKKENRDAYNLFISSWDNKAMVKLMKKRREEEEKEMAKKPEGETEEVKKINKIDESGKDEPETTTDGR